MNSGFFQRLCGMLKVDFIKIIESRLFYFLLACALLMSILMAAMMDDSFSVDSKAVVM